MCRRINPTEEQLREHEARQHCEMCEDKFVKGDKKKGKVMHHRHGTGDYIASICFQCNRVIRQPRQVPVFFHNGGGYDFKFLLRTIARLRNEPDPEHEDDAEDDDESEDEEHGDVPQVSLEEWMSEEVDFKKLRFKVLFKTGEKLLQLSLGNLVFRDSANFYNTSLEIMDNLAKTARLSARRAFAPTSPRRRMTAPSGTTDAGPGSCCCASCPCPSST